VVAPFAELCTILEFAFYLSEGGQESHALLVCFCRFRSTVDAVRLRTIALTSVSMLEEGLRGWLKYAYHRKLFDDFLLFLGFASSTALTLA
jgi:Zn-dependent M28 family amino/carboxypeptidase